VTENHPSLVHWSYDSPWNPLFGGGGAQRDWEILRRLSGSWRPGYNVGGFPGAVAPPEADSVPTRFLGKGRGRWGGRVAYAFAAQRLARNSSPGDGIWSISPSIFAPVPAYLRHPERTAVSLFHIVGWNAWRKYGPLGFPAILHERQILSRMRHFLCINHATAAQVRALRPDARIEVVPTGFTPLADVPAPARDQRILFFGRMDVYMKGLDRLLDAFATMARVLPSARLVLAGRADAEVQARVGQLLSGHPFAERIEVVPNPDDIRKAELFRSAAVFCSPSRFEGWCIAAVEAQSCAVPVVASTADGFLDSVDHDRSGILVPNLDATIAEGVASNLVRILTDPDLAARLGAGGLAKSARLTWDAVAARHDQVFRDILEDRR